MKVSYLKPIPSADRANAGKPFNVLGGVTNSEDEAISLPVSLWGKSDGGWLCLARQEVTLEPGEHRHLYFTITEECLLPAFWEQEDLEEIELAISHEMPGPEETGVLVFVV